MADSRSTPTPAILIPEAEIKRPVVQRLLAMMRWRNAHPAFAGEFTVGGDGSTLMLGWRTVDAFVEASIRQLGIDASDVVVTAFDPLPVVLPIGHEWRIERRAIARHRVRAAEEVAARADLGDRILGQVVGGRADGLKGLGKHLQHFA